LVLLRSGSYFHEFKVERYKPYFDLVSHINDKRNLKVIDLGCGTGELTQFLANALTNPTVLGIDISAEMLAKAPIQNNIVFKQKNIEEQLEENEKWDLIFSNAAIKWVDDHQALLPKIISKINSNGQLAIQMPSQTENILNKILIDLVQEEPYKSALNNWVRKSPALSLDEDARLLFDNGGDNLIIYQKVYPLVKITHDELYEFISGSSLVPYFERFNASLKE
jgi:trans-aconitate 2-methyltransferase